MSGEGTATKRGEEPQLMRGEKPRLCLLKEQWLHVVKSRGYAW